MLCSVKYNDIEYKYFPPESNMVKVQIFPSFPCYWRSTQNSKLAAAAPLELLN